MSTSAHSICTTNMVFASLRIDEMECLLPVVEAFLDEGLKDAVMLVHAVEERTDVAIRSVESIRRDPQRTAVAFHDYLPTSRVPRITPLGDAPPYSVPSCSHPIRRMVRRAVAMTGEHRSRPALHEVAR